MKHFLLSAAAALLFVTAEAQTIVYHETFDPADSVSATGNPAWVADNTLQVSGTSSYKNLVALNDTSWLTTNAFSTTGNFFVLLNFSQICKIDVFDKAQIQVSNDNGVTWNLLTNVQYQGSGALVNNNAFNAFSYSTTWQSGNNAAVPNNTWWQNETFDVSAFLSNAAQCKVRFKLWDGNSNGPFSNYGWLLDNVIVTASASELIPPTITLLPPIYTGTVYSLGPFVVNATITDASGIANADVVYTVNNGAPQTAAMSLVSGNDWLGTIPLQTDSDTICYYVRAIDASLNANQAQAPTVGCQSFITSAGITFPYVDDFEGDTLWTVVTPQPGTPATMWELGVPNFGTTNTTHSGINSWDLNLISACGQGVRTALISPVFDFSNAVNARMSFWMNYNTSASWDGIRVEYTTGSNVWNTLGTIGDPLATNWYTALSNTTGEPNWDGNSGGWVKSEYELSVLNNVVGPVQFRFVFASSTFTTSDGCSIDDFSIALPSPQDAGVITLLDPDISSCLPQGNIPITVRLRNYGTQNIVGPMPISYQLDNNPVVTESYTGTLVPAQIDTFTFATLLNNTAGTHTLRIFSGLSGDGFLLNDTLTVTYNTAPGVTVPYFNGFENGPSSLNDFCVTGGFNAQAQVLSSAANTGSGGLQFDALNSSGWIVFADTITSSPNYVWNTAVNPGQEINARLIVNTSGYNDLVLEFDAKQLYAFSNNYTNFRVKVNGQMITNHMSPNNANTPYDNFRYMLTSFLPAPFLTIDFEGKYAYSIATGTASYLDNIRIYEPDTLDAGNMLIVSPGAMSQAGTNNSVILKIRNYGLSPLTSIPVGYQVNNNPVVNATWTGNLAPNASTTYTFTTTYVAPLGQYNICAWTDLSGDNNTFNDSICKTSTGVPLVQAPFVDDMETTNNFAADVTYTPSWEYGTPLAPAITNAHSGSNCWEVNLNGNYQAGSHEILYSPFIDFSNANQAELRFWHWYNTEQFYDGCHVEYSTDGGNTWQVLGTQNDPNGTNWYNYFSVISSGIPGWTGLGSNYIQSKYKLNFLNFFATPVQFRFILTSGTTGLPRDGWSIDDFEIWMPINAGTNTISLSTPQNILTPGTYTLKANIKNLGLIALSDVDATLEIDGNIVTTDAINFSPVLNIQQTQNHTFSVPWTNAAPGNHVVRVWTSNPNGLNDTNWPDDTTRWAVTVFDTVGVYPYCNDFENGNGQSPWAAMNAIRFVNQQNTFELGDPVKNVITAPHSGTNCWITKRVGNYLPNDSSGLFTPVFDVQTGACYNFGFWHNYQTPQNTDGGVIEYSMDLGQTWQVFGQMWDPGWYNVTSVTGLGSGTDGFSGNTNGWVQAGHLISFNTNGQVVFRFRFGSDGSIQSEGWGIDDFCFEEWLSPCATGVEELAGTGLQLADNIPNPASQSTMIGYYVPDHGKVTITLRDMLGREVRTYTAEETAGSHQLEWEVSTLEEGVYTYSLEFGGHRLVKRLVVTH
jgi:hypothetical protein